MDLAKGTFPDGVWPGARPPEISNQAHPPARTIHLPHVPGTFPPAGIRYRVTNWPSYDQSLAQRGSLTVWFSPEAIKAWKPKQSGLRGGQRRYSDVAVRTALQLRLLLGLAWRQTEGLLQSLVDLIGLDLAVPDHTTLSRRSRNLAAVRFRCSSSRSIHLIVDASGLKVFGQGAWAVAKYCCRFPGTGWRKLHLAVDDRGSILAAELTDNDVADASVFPTLLSRVSGRIVRLTATVRGCAEPGRL